MKHKDNFKKNLGRLERVARRKGYVTRDNIGYIFKCYSNEDKMFLIEQLLSENVIYKHRKGIQTVFKIKDFVSADKYEVKQTCL